MALTASLRYAPTVEPVEKKTAENKYRKAIIIMESKALSKVEGYDIEIFRGPEPEVLQDRPSLDELINRIVPVTAETLEPGHGNEWTEHKRHRQLFWETDSVTNEQVPKIVFVIGCSDAIVQENTYITVLCQDLLDEKLLCYVSYM